MGRRREEEHGIGRKASLGESPLCSSAASARLKPRYTAVLHLANEASDLDVGACASHVAGFGMSGTMMRWILGIAIPQCKAETAVVCGSL